MTDDVHAHKAKHTACTLINTDTHPHVCPLPFSFNIVTAAIKPLRNRTDTHTWVNTGRGIQLPIVL